MIMLRSAISALALSVVLAGIAAAPARAQLFGPSDEEKAHEANQDSQLADLARTADQLNGRVQALENKVQNLTASLANATGTSEELSHRIQMQNQKIDSMQKDFAYRICTLSAQQLGVAGDGSDGGLNCAAAGGGGAAQGGFAVPTPQGAAQPGQALPPIGGGNGGANQQFAPGPSSQTALDDTPGRGRPSGILGTLPADPYGRSRASNDLNAPTRLSSLPPPPEAPQLRAGTSQFDAAMNLLSKAQYNEAAAAFQAYADAHPDDTQLAPQAIYWVGNINYTQRNYAPAQRSFAEVIKKYPKSSQAPEAMLKLAQSFLALGQKSEGCTTLGLIKSKYPQAPDSTVATVTSLRRTACR
jgi:tol-pal system protein YbgF